MEKIDSKLHRRQFELMKKRFDVDEQNKIVKLDLYYDKADDVLESNIDTKVPTFNRDKFGRIKEIISDFPQEYKADVNIKIDDYQDYKPQDVLDGFNDAVELTHYSGNREHKKKWIQITFLLLAGIVLLTLLARGLIENLQLSENGTTVFKEVFDIASWVFIWEAVSLMFLSPSEDRIVSLTLARRLHVVSFLDKNNKPVAKEHYLDSYALTAKERKLRIIGKYSLLVSGAAFLALGILDFASVFTDLPGSIQAINDAAGTPEQSLLVTMTVIFSVIQLLAALFETLGGFAAISAFIGKGRFYKMVLPFGIITFIFHSVIIVLSIIYQSSFISSAIGLLIAVAYLLGAIFLLVTREKVLKKK